MMAFNSCRERNRRQLPNYDETYGRFDRPVGIPNVWQKWHNLTKKKKNSTRTQSWNHQGVFIIYVRFTSLNWWNMVTVYAIRGVMVTHSRIQSHFLFGKLLLIEQFIYIYFFSLWLCPVLCSLFIFLCAHKWLLYFMLTHISISQTSQTHRGRGTQYMCIVWQCVEWNCVYRTVRMPYLVAGCWYCWTKCCLAIIL